MAYLRINSDNIYITKDANEVVGIDDWRRDQRGDGAVRISMRVTITRSLANEAILMKYEHREPPKKKAARRKRRAR